MFEWTTVPITHPAGVVYGTHCFLILPGSLFAVRTAKFPPPVFAGAGSAGGDGIVVEEEGGRSASYCFDNGGIKRK